MAMTKGQYSTTRPRQTCTNNRSHIRYPLPIWSPSLASFHQSWTYRLSKKHSGKTNQLTLANRGSKYAYTV